MLGLLCYLRHDFGMESMAGFYFSLFIREPLKKLETNTRYTVICLVEIRLVVICMVAFI